MKRGSAAGVAAPRVNTVSFGFYAGTGRLEAMAAADQHNEIELNFIERGAMVFRRGVETVSVNAGEGVAYWAAVPHQVLAVEADTVITWVSVPLSWFLGWELPAVFTRRLLEGGLLGMPAELTGGTVFSLAGWGRDFASEAEELKVVVRLELEAFFRRWALGATKASGVELAAAVAGEAALGTGLRLSGVLSGGNGYQCRHVERMVRYINEHFRDEITVAMVAGAAKLNPEYAMRLFQKRWGMTLWKFLLRQRVSEARRLLLLSDTPLIEIALGCGFQSLSRFYEAFKAECGCSPGAYRKRHAKPSQKN
ncbi:helix-turn-helix domain-containing protein [Geminisphaera colitermitum]|uniref:helix-turn-helix domain-containing protein n=1 Tax=Geminisphaera colitermitum TaxID=1148786 RepID=UPI0001964DDA|nr:helix-turn-helix domain-containing protein [Geminisphaera colitermitum]